MKNMISGQAVAAREQARQADGKFGNQHHSAPSSVVMPVMCPSDLDRTTSAAVNAATFSNHDWDTGEFEYLDESGLPVAEESRVAVRAEVERFVAEHSDLVRELHDRDGYDVASQFGHDLVFTAQGEGTGFWDRPQLKEGGLGERLTEAVDKTSRFKHAQWWIDSDAGVIRCAL